MAGKRLVEMALERDHEVTAFVRDPAKVKTTHTNLSIITGDILNPDTIEQAFDKPIDAVISTLGIFHREPCTELSAGTRNVLEAMGRHQVNRIVVVSTIGAGETRGQGNLVARFLQKHLLSHVIDDKNRQEKLLTESACAWTVVRPPQLTNASHICTNPVVWQGESPREPTISWKTSRDTVAHLLLDVVEHGKYINQAINISEPK
jgi:putative NADH-flavin reductase